MAKGAEVTTSRASALTDAASVALRRPGNWVQLAKFCAVGASGYVVNLAVYATLLALDVHYLLAAVCSFLVAAGVPKLPAQAIAIALVTPWNFVANKLWSFRRRRSG